MDYNYLEENNKLATAYKLAIKDIDKNKIGLLQEHTLHRVLKFYLSNNEENHEHQINKMYADVIIDGHIYEVQTKAFNAMRDKLNDFLKDYEVTIVHPMALNKMVYLTSDKGELISEKKSPRHLNPLEICLELYKIKSYLNNPNLNFKIMLLDMDEYRVQVPITFKRRRGYERENQIPTKINEIIDLKNKDDYLKLLKRYDLPKNFNSKVFAEKIHLKRNKQSTILNVLTYLEVVKRIGKNGNSYIYELNEGE